MDPRVHHCPRCGAPLQVPPGSWGIRCTYCQADVSLLGQANQSAPVNPPVTKTPPAATTERSSITYPLMVGIFGLLAPPTFFFLDRNDSTDRPVIMAIAGSIAGFVLFVIGKRLIGSVLALAVGLVLALKPFVRPVRYDGHAMSLNSETHYYFLIPGFLMSAVFAWLLLTAIETRNTQATSVGEKKRNIIAALVFFAGAFASNTILGGPTTADVLQQYKPRAMAMRGAWQRFAASLPGPDAFEPRERKLDPSPVWRDYPRSENNIEIVHANQLRDPDDEIQYGNLYLNGDLTYALGWTGPKNKLASSRLGEPGGQFDAQLARAFATPWLAVYRSGKNGIEVFVFDMKTGEIVAATIAKGTTSGFTDDRNAIMKALEKATGGTFQVR